MQRMGVLALMLLATTASALTWDTAILVLTPSGPAHYSWSESGRPLLAERDAAKFGAQLGCTGPFDTQDEQGLFNCISAHNWSLFGVVAGAGGSRTLIFKRAHQK